MIKDLLEKIETKFPIWKDYCNEFRNLIESDQIFSKLPAIVIKRLRYGDYAYSNQGLIFLKKYALIPVLLFWKLFLIKFECLYQEKKYQNVCTFKNIEKESFEYLFVLNTKDHLIAAIPILQHLNKTRNVLIIMFREMYPKYKDDFDTLDNAKILFFDYELKNLPIQRYIEIANESNNKYEIIKSYGMDKDLKEFIKIDSNYIKLHLQEELVQYYFFENIFSTFDIKGVISMIFTTAFEIAKKNNITTFVLQHGIGGGDLEDHPHMCDYKIVYDDMTKEHLDEWLGNTVDVIALGTPRFEYLKEHLAVKKDIAGFNKQIGKSGYGKIVTYIGTNAENQLSYQALKYLRKHLPESVNLIIKSHPRVPLHILNLKEEMKKSLTQNEFEHTTFIRDEIDFYDILAHSDIVISAASTGMLEAIAIDIPTFQVNFTGGRYLGVYDLASYGWKEPINDPAILVKEVLSIVSDKRRYNAVIEKQKWLKNRMF
ncbi:hypothetical protein KAU11_06865, partial [Candidatus Babeliales bacterium]|nr:hypothetical protein [Candidatus Babeliales bacterium]